MFSVSFPEIFLLLLVILIVFGPERLPEMAKNLGQFMGRLRSHTDGMRKEFYNAVYTPAKDIKKEINTLTTDIKSIAKEEVLKEKNSEVSESTNHKSLADESDSQS